MRRPRRVEAALGGVLCAALCGVLALAPNAVPADASDAKASAADERRQQLYRATGRMAVAAADVTAFGGKVVGTERPTAAELKPLERKANASLQETLGAVPSQGAPSLGAVPSQLLPPVRGRADERQLLPVPGADPRQSAKRVAADMAAITAYVAAGQYANAAARAGHLLLTLGKFTADILYAVGKSVFPLMPLPWPAPPPPAV
ncbi:hypothetical protein G5C51_32520 [Streptomyces sp. A7024]|uniref:Uncharacterized protein n=1 Tax=Streptomyces coryli TaxID=1128680 RepID=A0A6G4UA90_9ACTN|nr:hypothetical protein [Streptomyces coryli]NGN68606.1 hypothetical protein [Streptomyces coryli]